MEGEGDRGRAGGGFLEACFFGEEGQEWKREGGEREEAGGRGEGKGGEEGGEAGGRDGGIFKLSSLLCSSCFTRVRSVFVKMFRSAQQLYLCGHGRILDQTSLISVSFLHSFRLLEQCDSVRRLVLHQLYRVRNLTLCQCYSTVGLFFIILNPSVDSFCIIVFDSSTLSASVCPRPFASSQSHSFRPSSPSPLASSNLSSCSASILPRPSYRSAQKDMTLREIT